MGSTNTNHDGLPEPFPETPDAVEAADWGDRDADVVATYADGGFVVSFSMAGGKYDPLTDSWYYVPPGAGDGPDADAWQDWYAVDRYGGRRGTNERTARLIGRLNENTEFWWKDATTTDAIPVCVATDGQKAIAAYLYARQNYSVDGIADVMDKAESTVRQYLSDYKAGRTG